MNDLNIPGTDLWKYDSDSTISETVTKLEDSKVQQTVDEFAKQVAADEFQLNETKCTKLLITFIHPKRVNGQDWKYMEEAISSICDRLPDRRWVNQVYVLSVLFREKRT